MLARWVRAWAGRVLRPVLLTASRYGVNPNGLTIAGLFVIVASGITVSQRRMMAGGILLLVGGLLDAVDGELARVANRDTPFGAFLDSTADHAGDFALHLGLLWVCLEDTAWISILLVFFSLFGSMLGSQIRSRAVMVGLDTKDIGLFTRFERLLVLGAGLLFGRITVALWILAVMNTVSALQRLAHVVAARRAAMAGSCHGNSSVAPVNRRGPSSEGSRAA